MCRNRVEQEIRGGDSLTFAVVTEGHLGLAETNCVLSGTDTVELLEVGLLDILFRGEKMSARAQVQINSEQLVVVSGGRTGCKTRHQGLGREVSTYLAGEVDLNGLDANVLGTRSHLESYGTVLRTWRVFSKR